MPFQKISARLVAKQSIPLSAPGCVETSVSIILAPGPRGLETLLIQRAERAGDPWSGHMGLPGGRREPADADRLATAIRETQEEIGVALPPERLLGCLDDLHPHEPSLPAILIRPFVFGLDPRPDAATSSEVVASYWIPLAALGPTQTTSTVAHRGKSISVPSFAVPGLPGGRVIWGLTYRILSSLLPLV